MLRHWLSELLPRRVAVALGIRRLSPHGFANWPARTVRLERPPGDTGGGYRPNERPQDPAIDPREPSSSESASAGNSHGWSNCTMSSGAIALAYQTLGEMEPYGGHLRHEQGDQEAGTDLYDLREAWENYAGETLTIKSGAGWSAVVDAHNAKRAIVIQGTGQVPGSGDYDGAHACAIGIDTKDGKWLWYDPLCTSYQWISPSAIKEWAARFSSGIAFAVSRVVEEEEPPDPPPPPPPEPDYDDGYTDGKAAGRIEGYNDGYGEGWNVGYRYGYPAGQVAAGDALLGDWLAYLEAPPPAPADRWDSGSWWSEAGELERELEDPCAPPDLELIAASWSRLPIPEPAQGAIEALHYGGSWDGTDWAGSLWQT